MERLEQLWDALWEDLRHHASGKPSGEAIIARHRLAIEAAARQSASSEAEANFRLALAALENYGNHRAWCQSPPCGCGFDETLAKMRAIR